MFVLSCESLNVDDPNASSPDRASVQNLVTGIESQIKRNVTEYVQWTGVVARESHLIQTVDPRLHSLYKETKEIHNYSGDFIGTRVWNARYRTIRGLNDLEAKTSDPLVHAFTKTLKAHQFMILINMYEKSGIRRDVADPNNMGPIVTDVKSNYEYCATLLDEANSTLSGVTGNLPFTTVQFPNTVAEFKKFNRALKARAALYAENWQEALTAVNESFIKETDELDAGAYYIFTNSNNDLARNPAYDNNSVPTVTYVAHNSMYTDAIAAGEANRADKVLVRLKDAKKDTLMTRTLVEPGGSVYSSIYGFKKSSSPTDKFPIIKNAELILIRAEAKLKTGDAAGATADLNIIRAKHSLTALTGDATIDHILHERRYELLSEGHRWIDLRRTGKLTFDNIPKDNATDGIVTHWALPQDE